MLKVNVTAGNKKCRLDLPVWILNSKLMPPRVHSFASGSVFVCYCVVCVCEGEKSAREKEKDDKH